MIKRLQKKFITITALCLLAVMVALLAGINVANVIQVNSDSDQLLKMLSDNGGKFPEEKQKNVATGGEPAQKETLQGKTINDGMNVDAADKKDGMGGGADKNRLRPFGLELTPETQFRTRYFVVREEALAVAGAKPALEVADSSHIAALTEGEILEYATAVAASGKLKGYRGNYRYLVTENPDGTRVYVFLDCQESLRNMRNFALLSLIVGVVCMILVTLLVWVFSKRAIRPTIDAIERQKQFVTDAGHEIKTPLSIILANTEVMELEQGESQWTESIRNQVTRLNMLVKNLLELSRLDEVSQGALELSDVNMSELMSSAVEAFAALMQTSGLAIEENIEENVHIMADVQCMNQLVSILLDNAHKYARANSVVEVGLHAIGKRIELSVYNPCQNLSDKDLDCLFERFYRADESRSRKTGGYGIGLSVARGIAQAHRGRIYAERMREGVRFVVVLPKV